MGHPAQHQGAAEQDPDNKKDQALARAQGQRDRAHGQQLLDSGREMTYAAAHAVVSLVADMWQYQHTGTTAWLSPPFPVFFTPVVVHVFCPPLNSVRGDHAGCAQVIGMRGARRE
ncbi:hypothetical protein, partial [Roseiflexus castenholzii]|uniref:hypothetical protein n=1 Tax=Roseiflexus castenholzii TaxID=120962 RepID=UPI003C7E42A3